MRGLTLEAMEAKARDFQAASAIAYNYTKLPYGADVVISCQNNQRIASAAARRYLWAAIERSADYRAMDMAITEDDLYISAYVEGQQ